MEAFPMQLHIQKTKGRDKLERERDGGRKTERRLAWETAEMNTKKKNRRAKKKYGIQRGQRAGPPKHQRLLGARNEGAGQ